MHRKGPQGERLDGTIPGVDPQVLVEFNRLSALGSLLRGKLEGEISGAWLAEVNRVRANRAADRGARFTPLRDAPADPQFVANIIDDGWEWLASTFNNRPAARRAARLANDIRNSHAHNTTSKIRPGDASRMGALVTEILNLVEAESPERDYRKGDHASVREEGPRWVDLETDVWLSPQQADQGTVAQIKTLVTVPYPMSNNPWHVGAEKTELRRFRVHVPPGVQDGYRLRVEGQGAPGAHGRRAGDLYVCIRVSSTPSRP